MPAPVSEEQVAFALHLADVAAEIVRARFRQPFTVESKADASPVTEVDRLVEAACRERVTAHRPQDGVIGEEYGPERPQAPWQWIIDPIDGTRAFMAGRPTFGTLIAAAYEGRPVLGVIDQPIVRDRWVGVAGQPTRFNGGVASTRRCAVLSAAVLGTTTPELFAGDAEPVWQALQQRTASRLYGGDCTLYGALACGWLDVVIEQGLKTYDFAALVPVIEGAGGSLTDWRGQPLSLISDGRVLAVGDQRLLVAALDSLSS
ncbi:MAG TPA: inositol monophosphatase family protein [Steroidobacteraceae bacterium]|nr:inositol monophosphatase family protein [Steroidobacteraceae bacterium]HRX90377.1 inositol monophosphatase family protein [Steroidobacteraceae bacterium]